MPQLVFGPHPTGLNFFGLHIPLVTTSVYRGDTGTVPTNLTVTGAGPLGQTTSCAVANGTTMTVTGIGKLNVEYLINDCRVIPAAGATPEQYAFTITLRAIGSVSIKLISIPVNLQVDAFDAVIATDAATHVTLVNSPPVAVG